MSEDFDISIRSDGFREVTFFAKSEAGEGAVKDGDWISFVDLPLNYFNRIKKKDLGFYLDYETELSEIVKLNDLNKFTRLDSGASHIDYRIFPNLKYLKYYCRRNENPDFLSNPSLESLDLEDAPFNDLSQLSSLKKLRHLRSIGGNFKSLDGIEEYENLVEFRLLENKNKIDVSPLGKNTNLRILEVGNLKKSRIQTISKLRNLEVLFVYGSDGTLENLDIVKNNNKLQFLIICCQINNKSLEALAEHAKLEHFLIPFEDTIEEMTVRQTLESRGKKLLSLSLPNKKSPFINAKFSSPGNGIEIWNPMVRCKTKPDIADLQGRLLGN